MKYFNSNICCGMDLHDLHDTLHKAAGVVESNILFNLTHKPEELPEAELTLMKSVCNVIAVCEAILDTASDGVAEKAIAEIRNEMAGINADKEAVSALSRLVFGGGAQ